MLILFWFYNTIRYCKILQITPNDIQLRISVTLLGVINDIMEVFTYHPFE